MRSPRARVAVEPRESREKETKKNVVGHSPSLRRTPNPQDTKRSHHHMRNTCGCTILCTLGGRVAIEGRGGGGESGTAAPIHTHICNSRDITAAWDDQHRGILAGDGGWAGVPPESVERTGMDGLRSGAWGNRGADNHRHGPQARHPSLHCLPTAGANFSGGFSKMHKEKKHRVADDQRSHFSQGFLPFCCHNPQPP
jgi:hypothetical protein